MQLFHFAAGYVLHPDALRTKSTLFTEVLFHRTDTCTKKHTQKRPKEGRVRPAFV